MKLKTMTTLALLWGAAAPTVVQAIDFTKWHTPAQIDAELAGLAAAHPTMAKIMPIGTTGQGRVIQCLKISDNVNSDEADEGAVVFVALHHAREWLSAEMALGLAEHLLNAYAAGTDVELNACMDNLEIWVIPVINPDGYAYTVSTDRFWRKNRRDNGDGTYGVDLNRNYGYQWGGGSGSEGSDFTVDETYRGPSPFSEPETAALRDFVLGRNNPKAVLSYHTYSELFLRPWAYTNADPPGEPTLCLIAQDSIARIAAVHGHIYGETIWYYSYGEMVDFFWNQNRIASFTTELRPKSALDGGFDPPTNQIIPTIQENIPAAIALIKDAGCRKVWIKDCPGDTGAEPSAVWLGDHWSQDFWTSPDIWTVPEALIEGSTVSLKVRVHNDMASTMTGCIVRAYYTDPRIALEFPSLESTFIGEQPTSLPPGDTTLSYNWTVPTGTNSWGERHWCVGAIVTHPDDRPLTTQIQRSSNVACRNFETTVSLQAGRVLLVGIRNYLNVPVEFRVTVDRERLPKGWKTAVPTLASKADRSRKARLLGIHANVLDPGEMVVQPVRLQLPEGVKPGTVQEVTVHGALLPLVPGPRVPVGNGYTFRVRVAAE